MARLSSNRAKRSRQLCGLGVLMLAGCRGTLDVTGPCGASVPLPGDAIIYWLPQDVVELTAEVVQTPDRVLRLRDGGTAGSVLVAVEAPPRRLRSNAAVEVRRVADPDGRVALSPTGGGLRQLEARIELAPEGWLKGMNLASSGEAGAVVRSLSGIAATAAGVMASARAPEARHEVPGRLLALLAAEGRPAAAEAGRLAQLDNRTLFLLQEEPTARDLWLALRRAEDERDAVREMRMRLLTPASPVNEGQATALRATLDALAFKAKGANEEHGVLCAELSRRRDAFLAVRELDREERTEIVCERLALDELPPPEALGASGLSSLDAAEAALAADSRWAKALALLRRTGVLLVLEEMTSPPPAARPPPRHAVLHRLERPAVLLTLVASPVHEAAAADAGLTVARSLPLRVVDRRSPLASVPVRASWWGSRRTALDFSRGGILASVETDAASSAAEAGEAAARATVAVRQELEATLQSVRDMEADAGAQRLRHLDRRIAETSRRRALLEERIALQGVQAGYEQLAEAQALQAELRLLRLQHDLEAERQ